MVWITSCRQPFTRATIAFTNRSFANRLPSAKPVISPICAKGFSFLLLIPGSNSPRVQSKLCRLCRLKQNSPHPFTFALIPFFRSFANGFVLFRCQANGCHHGLTSSNGRRSAHSRLLLCCRVCHKRFSVCLWRNWKTQPIHNRLPAQELRVQIPPGTPNSNIIKLYYTIILLAELRKWKWLAVFKLRHCHFI